jgi:hypothetical protein
MKENINDESVGLAITDDHEGGASVRTIKTFSTSDLYLASYLLARGYKLLLVDGPSYEVRFHFSRMAKVDSQGFYGGGVIEARLLCNAIRDLKAVVARRRRGEGDEGNE